MKKIQKSNRKLDRVNSNASLTRHLKQSKRSLKVKINSGGHLRRSTRISQRQLRLYCSLPESDDSENEADEGANLELLELSDSEENTKRYVLASSEEEHMDDEESEEEDIDMKASSEEEYMDVEESEEEDIDMNYDDAVEEDIEQEVAKVMVGADNTWGCDTVYFDKLDQSFCETANIIGDIGELEIDYFEKIFDNHILSKIVTETNRYAEQKKSKNWSNVTVDELKVFIGCLVVMGIHKLPALKNYWSSDPFLRVDSVASVMTANRFKKIVENIHCNNNETQQSKNHPNYDKLHKVKPLVELLNETIRKIYKPSDIVTVDESMIPFKGRYVLKQYMPKKPVKWGYKVWCLADAITGQSIFHFKYERVMITEK